MTTVGSIATPPSDPVSGVRTVGGRRAAMLSHRLNIVGIHLHRRRLLNQMNGDDESCVSAFAQERSPHALQWSTDHLDLHSLLKVRVRIERQCARYQLANGFNLPIWDGSWTAVDA